MTNTSRRRLVVPTVAALTLGMSLSACGAANEGGSSGSSSKLSGTINGAGSTAQEDAQKVWRSNFQMQNPKVTVNYAGVGSGGGVEKFTGKAVQYAGSDSPLDPTAGEVAGAKKACGANAIEVPDYVSPIAIIFNVKGVKSLNLSPDVIAQIFDGKIKKWNDPKIAADNKGVKLPSTTISPVHRSDESGTTKNFTDYLSKAGKGSWSHEPDKVWPTKSGKGANGTSGVVSAVSQGDGAIGYADLSQASGLSQASIKVGNAFVKPSASGAAKALEASSIEKGRPSGDMAYEVNRTTTESGAYPLMLVSYLIACPSYSKSQASAVKAYLSYVVSSKGQQDAAKKAGSAPLPSSVQKQASKYISGIKAK